MGDDDFAAVGAESFGYAAPVLEAWEEGARETEFVETHEAVGEDDGVFGGCVFLLDQLEIILNCPS